MTHLAHALLAATLFGQLAGAQTTLEIALAHDSPAEAQTRTQLQRLVAAHDLSPWIFTRKIVVDEQSTPHSHPVLTLHTRHDKDDELLLSTFVHEQFHWYASDRKDATEAAMADLRNSFRFPRAPQPTRPTSTRPICTWWCVTSSARPTCGSSAR